MWSVNIYLCRSFFLLNFFASLPTIAYMIGGHAVPTVRATAGAARTTHVVAVGHQEVKWLIGVVVAKGDGTTQVIVEQLKVGQRREGAE